MAKAGQLERRTTRYWWVMAALVALLIPVLGIGGNPASADPSYDSDELQFLQLINDYRQQNGVGPLILSDTLTMSSEHHSQDMARYAFFAHNTVASSYYARGSQPWDRMVAEGYAYNTYKGENIATGYDTAEEVFQAWRESPSHNEAMLDGHYRVIGIARLYAPSSNHHWYWTTDFGGYVDPTSHGPGQSPQAQETESQPPKDPPEKKPRKDEGGMENGSMNTQAVWRQRARDGADLILEEGYARLGGYDDGIDDLSQKITVGKETRLIYGLRIKTEERRHPSDRLVVRVTNEDGKQLAVLRRYTDEDAGERRRPKVDLSRFAGRTVHLSFHVVTDEADLTTFYVDNVILERG
ncbi:MAG TPA: CAP domain-containing protein [Rubrobacter sp.]|nr:CAP domain-containing protein [Rubrobacter sp.]